MKNDLIKRYGGKLTPRERAALIARAWSRDKALALELLTYALEQGEATSRVIAYERENGVWVGRGDDGEIVSEDPKDESPDQSPMERARQIAKAWKEGREDEAVRLLAPSDTIVIDVPIGPVQNERGELVVMGFDGKDQSFVC